MNKEERFLSSLEKDRTPLSGEVDPQRAKGQALCLAVRIKAKMNSRRRMF